MVTCPLAIELSGGGMTCGELSYTSGMYLYGTLTDFSLDVIANKCGYYKHLFISATGLVVTLRPYITSWVTGRKKKPVPSFFLPSFLASILPNVQTTGYS